MFDLTLFFSSFPSSFLVVLSFSFFKNSFVSVTFFLRFSFFWLFTFSSCQHFLHCVSSVFFFFFFFWTLTWFLFAPFFWSPFFSSPLLFGNYVSSFVLSFYVYVQKPQKTRDSFENVGDCQQEIWTTWVYDVFFKTNKSKYTVSLTFRKIKKWKWKRRWKNNLWEFFQPRRNSENMFWDIFE